MNIKTILITLIVITSSAVASAQLTTTPKCNEINVDVLEGTINKNLLPSSTVGQIKLNLPCFTSFEEDGPSAKCSAGVFFKDKDINFYTSRDYIEIGPAFKGKLSVPLMSAARNSLFKLLGSPLIKDVKWDAFKTSYGILILYYNSASQVNKIQMSTMSVNTIQLCE